MTQADINEGCGFCGKRQGGEYLLALYDRNARVTIALNPTEALSLSQSIKASLKKMRAEWAKAHPTEPPLSGEQLSEKLTAETASEEKPQ